MDNPKDMQERAAGAAFTPGPWSLRRAVCRHDHPDTSADVHGRDGQFVADCGCHEQATPNATLISAAPDLYSVLSALLDDMEDRYDGAPDSGSRWMGWHISKGREALAKAGSK